MALSLSRRAGGIEQVLDRIGLRRFELVVAAET
jgi:hypothetical protein